MKTVINDFILTLKSDETKRAYRRYLLGFLDFLPGNITSYDQFRCLDPKDLRTKCEQYLQPMLKRDSESGALLSSSKRDAARNALASFFNYLIWELDYPKNPCYKINNIRALEFSNTEDLTEDEVVTILLSLKKKAPSGYGAMRDFVLVTTMFVECLRRTEVRRLRWSQFNFVQRTVRVRVKGNSEKINPVPESYLNLLNEYRNRYTDDSPYLFRPIQNNRGGKNLNRPIAGNTVYKIVTTASRELFPNRNITPHSMRASYVTIGLNWDIDLKKIQNGTGHASLDMVGYYDRRDKITNNLTHNIGDLLTRRGIL